MKFQLLVVVAVTLVRSHAQRTRMNIAIAKSISGQGALALRQVVDGDMSTCVSFKDIDKIKLDLARPFDIHRVRMRLDHRVRGKFPDVQIRTGNHTNPNRNHECLKHVLRSDSAVFGKDCHDTCRYINIRKMKNVKSLMLCELEVVAPVCEPPVPVTDVAKGKDIVGAAEMINQRSVDDHGVEFDMTNVHGVHPLAKNRDQPSWKIDLGESFDIYQVDIINTDDCPDYPIVDTEVRVGDDGNDVTNNAVCDDVVQLKMVQKGRFNFHCGCDSALRGRYVSGTLKSNDPEKYTACKVRVMAG
ncbi:uncharacterized protein [Ptychodera flava]|uniref:uncharacterized protein n=1 Tax=Ptychodera flava TaxID=63121 RepID=UPI00396A485A